MKTYVFENGHLDAENLNAKAIKAKEKELGELLGVKINHTDFIPVDRKKILITYKGESHTFKEWAEITGINERTLRSRYSKGERDYMLFRKVGI